MRFPSRCISSFLICTAFLVCSFAHGDDDESASSFRIEETPITAGDRDHWAYHPLKRSAVPKVKNAGWCRNAIDRFILARLEAEGLQPQRQANPAALIRRVTFDVTGLPPKSDDVVEFIETKNELAYEQLVERLLASPQHGEHVSQSWLDLARFAETDGFEHDKTRSTAWKYRDWVINAFNTDLPYDRFVQHQLAGDSLQDANSSTVTATAFCLSGPDMPDINSQEERRQNLLNEMAGTVGAVFFALQFGCAQCHDHKYDPISQGDFYRLRAFFDPAVVLKKNQSIGTFQHDKRHKGPSHFLIRGSWERLGPEVIPAVPRLLQASSQTLKHDSRTELADWMTNDAQPLVARVIVNRIWQQHFGHGLVRSPNDFGIMGDIPSHPQLLDWLAIELIQNDWSLKHIRRLVLTSATYRQSSLLNEDYREQILNKDPTDRLLSRYPRRRLTGETIRDALLVATDLINRQQEGPGVMPPLPKELRSTLLKNQWKTGENVADHHRRSIYVFARRNLRYPIFEAFDRPSANTSCPRRNQSTTAPQALLLLNSEMSLSFAKGIATKILSEHRSNESRISALILKLFSRPVTPAEIESVSEFLVQQSRIIQAENNAEQTDQFPIAAWTNLCLALINTNEFIYLD